MVSLVEGIAARSEPSRIPVGRHSPHVHLWLMSEVGGTPSAWIPVQCRRVLHTLHPALPPLLPSLPEQPAWPLSCLQKQSRCNPGLLAEGPCCWNLPRWEMAGSEVVLEQERERSFGETFSVREGRNREALHTPMSSGGRKLLGVRCRSGHEP